MNYEEHVAFTDAVQGNIHDDEFHRHAEFAKEEARRIALNEAMKIFSTINSIIDNPVPVIFGGRWERRISSTRSQLIEHYGDATSDLVWIAARCFEYSKWEAAGMIAGLCRIRPIDSWENELWSRLATPNGYADYDGWAWTAYNGVINSINKPCELLKGSSFHEYPVASDILNGNGLIWFYEAARLYEIGDQSAFDMLYEASSAFDLSGGIVMWDEGHKCGVEDQDPSAHLRKLAQKAATARHAEDREIAERIKQWWLDNREEFKSMDAAAEAATKIEPIAFSTARKHIGEASKKLRSASKA